jgi:hypothetical protein
MKAFIIFRDRVTYGRQCLAAMEAAGLEAVIVDHGSTWPEAVSWLAELKKTTGVIVVDCGGGHPRDLWQRTWFRQMCAQDQYIVTDPDVVPSQDCPLDWPQHLAGVLKRHPFFHKAGLGLRIDRIPDHYSRKHQVTGWEGQFWNNPVADEHEVYEANIDTTLALHVPLMEQGAHSFTALRTGAPYLADHLAWHEDLENLTDEQRWYHEHAEPEIVNWTIRGRGAADHILEQM